MPKSFIHFGLTILIFTLIVSLISPVISIKSDAAQTLPDEDFTATPTPKSNSASKLATSSAKPKASVATPAADKSPRGGAKYTILKGELSATPSAVGKFNINTNKGEKTVDTDKNTKVYLIDREQKSNYTLSKIKIGDKIITFGNNTDENSYLARYVLVYKEVTTEKPNSAMYGIVTSREASGSGAFTLHIKNPSEDKDQEFLLNSDTIIKVKDLEAPKLNDVKIGDRVTLTFNEKNIITRIYVIPGRAAGLLRDIRESTESGQKESEKPTSSSKATSSSRPSTKTSSAGQ